MDTSITQAPDWAAITTALAAPFDSADIDFKPLSKDVGSDGKVAVAAYIDARCVQDRLDEVVPGAWSFDWVSLHINATGAVTTAKGTITIHGMSRSDIGDGEGNETSKSTVSDAEKRAAVQWGIGRYLYALPPMRARMVGKVISDAEKVELRKHLQNGTENITKTSQPTVTPTKNAQPSITKAEQAKIVAEQRKKLQERAHTLGISDADFNKSWRWYPTVADMAAALNRREAEIKAAEQQEEAPSEPQEVREAVELDLDTSNPVHAQQFTSYTASDWDTLKGRGHRIGAYTTNQDWEKLMGRFGGSYEDVLAHVERYENHDLTLLGTGSGVQ